MSYVFSLSSCPIPVMLQQSITAWFVSFKGECVNNVSLSQCSTIDQIQQMSWKSGVPD